MDIDYLLMLQRFRESIDNFLTPFMEGISLFAVTYLIMLPVFLYCVALYPLVIKLWQTKFAPADPEETVTTSSMDTVVTDSEETESTNSGKKS